MKPSYDFLETQYTLLKLPQKAAGESNKESWLERAKATIAFYSQRERTRSQLSRLSPEQLEDIGLTHQQAEKELKKPFWK